MNRTAGVSASLLIAAPASELAKYRYGVDKGDAIEVFGLENLGLDP
ncbi:MAG: hypothetical protein ACUVS3_00560 [Thermodesulfobacteriota bacterium]